MKKIFAISLIAMTAVTTANAEIASKAYVDPATDGTYVKTTYTTGRNLKELDTQVKANTDKLPEGDTTVAQAIATALQNANVATAIQGVEVNGTALTPDANGVVDVTVPTTAADVNAVAKNADITAGTATKITYDAKGLVTAGADLAESDIPSLHLSKITDVTATAAEVNQLHDRTLGSAANADVAQSITENGTGLATAGQVYAQVEAAKTAQTYVGDSATVSVDASNNHISAVTGAIAQNGTGLVTSGTIYTALAGKQDTLTFDTAPTEDSTNPVESGGVYTALAGKQDTIAAGTYVGTVTTSGSGNVVTAVSANTNGTVTVSTGDAIMKTDTINANGTYVLTATRSGTEGNYTYTYQWENITRGN